MANNTDTNYKSNSTSGPGSVPNDTSGSTPSTDKSLRRRALLGPKPAARGTIFGNSPLLAPLVNKGGMVWPYQPQISYNQEVDYQQVSMTHTNQEFYAYTKTNAVKLTCAGDFSVQSQQDGLYALGCLHFLRTVTKMYFGQGADLGTPPPVLMFDAYGQYMFNQLPVIVTGFTSEMPKDIDYVPIDLRGLDNKNGVGSSSLQPGDRGYVWLPAVFNISVNMTVQNTPAKLRTFNLNDFRSGALMKSPNGGWI